MPLPLTNLDDRRWADLVDEGVALVPRYAPGWTDHNIHDPGRTLIELFAWLTEMAVYRLNRVPPRHRRKFLLLLGFVAQPPRAAELVFSFSVDANTASLLLPAGTQFETSAQPGQQVAFSTIRDVNLSTTNLAVIQVDSGNIHDYTADWRDGLGVAVFGNDPSPGAVLYLGFRDLPAQVPVALWFRFSGPGNNQHERRRIIAEAEEQRNACRKVLPDIQCESSVPSTEETPLLLPGHHSARVVWEVFTGPAHTDWAPLESIGMPSRPAVGQIVDDTRSLTLDGLVELALPQAVPAAQLGEVASKLFYVRCRLLQGGYDALPILLDVRSNSVVAEQSVPAWQTLPIAAGVQAQGTAPKPGQHNQLVLSLDGQGQIKSLQFLDPGTLEAPNIAVLNYKPATMSVPGEITVEMTLLGTGTGRPLASLWLKNAPIQVESLHLFTHSGGAWREWSRREDMDSSQRTDLHFALNPTTGEFVFGNGERGGVPAEHELIFAMYRSTQADLGNIAADAKIIPSDNLHNQPILAKLTQAQRSQLKHVQQETVEEGAAEEGLEHCTGRAVEKLHAHERLLNLAAEMKSNTLDQLDQSRVKAIAAPGNAVNLLDLERLALDVPGTRVARAQACASLHPDYPCLHAPGLVRVVIVPEARVPMPQPTPGLTQTVKRFLDRRRTVCTRVEVMGPQYLEVRVITTVKVQSGADRTRVKNAIQRALDTFFDPFVGGPNGRGWPFGRNVYRTEIMQLIADVPGVSHVLSLLLSSASGENQCGDLSLCPSFLVTAGKHEIEVLK